MARIKCPVGIAAIVVAVVTTLSSCQFLDQVAPTVIQPVIQDEPTSSPGEVDESPRMRNAQDVPPTWTPPSNIGRETPVAPEAVFTPEAGSQGSYTVQQGDTLAEIAIRYNVTLEALASANDIEDYDHIEVGQVLIIP